MPTEREIDAAATAMERDFDHDTFVRRIVDKDGWKSAARAALAAAEKVRARSYTADT